MGKLPAISFKKPLARSAREPLKPTICPRSGPLSDRVLAPIEPNRLVQTKDATPTPGYFPAPAFFAMQTQRNMKDETEFADMVLVQELRSGFHSICVPESSR